jgi:hypothetical protein
LTLLVHVCLQLGPFIEALNYCLYLAHWAAVLTAMNCLPEGVRLEGAEYVPFRSYVEVLNVSTQMIAVCAFLSALKILGYIALWPAFRTITRSVSRSPLIPQKKQNPYSNKTKQQLCAKMQLLTINSAISGNKCQRLPFRAAGVSELRVRVLHHHDGLLDAFLYGLWLICVWISRQDLRRVLAVEANAGRVRF